MIIKEFWTKVDGSNKVFGRNDYVLGVIVGIAYVVCNGIDTPLYNDEETGDVYFGIRCSEEELYDSFARTVEEKYPNLCEFYVEEPNWIKSKEEVV